MNERDAILVARARARDDAAFEQLIRRYFHASYHVALAQLDEPADAEDACQDAFVRAWERLDECRDPEKFGAWLIRIVRNTAHNRREYLRVRLATALDPSLPAGGVAAGERLERRELAASLMKAMSQLPVVQRMVVVLHEMEDWRHADICAALGISEELSRRHLSTARKLLRTLLSHLRDREGT